MLTFQCTSDVRRAPFLQAGGLKDLPNARPGQGYTGHSFNDSNHCDLTTMQGKVSHNENKGEVAVSDCARAFIGTSLVC